MTLNHSKILYPNVHSPFWYGMHSRDAIALIDLLCCALYTPVLSTMVPTLMYL